MGGEGSGKDGDQGPGTMKKGPWTAAEDAILVDYVKKHGEGNWNAVQRNSGLSRCGKSCRLRWANHLRPNLKKGPFTPDEERLILELHAKLGNKWARMATQVYMMISTHTNLWDSVVILRLVSVFLQLPGRTDNEIKNYWNTRIKRRQRVGLPLYPPEVHHQTSFRQQQHHDQSRQSLRPDNKLAQFAATPAPLSLFDPIRIGFSSASSSSTTMGAGMSSSLMGHSLFGNSQQKQLKRPREESLGMPTMLIGGQAAPAVGLGCRNDVMGLQQQYSPFSIEMELPSSQFVPAPPANGEDPWARNNSGLLDALLEDTHRGRAAATETTNRSIGVCDPSKDMFLPKSTSQENTNIKGAAEDLKLSNDNGNGGSHGLPSECCKMKNKQPENVASGNEDLSALLDFMPPSNPMAANWLKNDSRETSNGQSSGVTEDDLGLEMQQLASSLTVAADDHAWNVGSDHWDNMPGIC